MEDRLGGDEKMKSRKGMVSVAAWISEKMNQETERGGTTPAVSDSTDLDEEILRWIRREEHGGPR